MFCFSSSVSWLTLLSPYSCLRMISAAISPVSAPAPPANPELPCSSATAAPNMAWAIKRAASLSPACILICSANHGALAPAKPPAISPVIMPVIMAIAESTPLLKSLPILFSLPWLFCLSMACFRSLISAPKSFKPVTISCRVCSFSLSKIGLSLWCACSVS
ncbi:hypothetical protein GAPWKB11_1991 [Gilliamella apicola]|nr:hypothetical protein GAPWKB11_1991 [Gilliamella apicola]